MKEAKVSAIPAKHREDIIDTILLRAREKRVFYSLLIVLLITIAYENNSWLLAELFSESHSVSQLGERRGANIGQQMFLPLGRAIKMFENEYPQFWGSVGRQKRLLSELTALLENHTEREPAMAKAKELLEEMLRFIRHPAISENKAVLTIDKDIQKIMKALKFSFLLVDDYRPVKFGGVDILTIDSHTRNLFEFAD